MIVRLMSDGQYRVPDDIVDGLRELDDQAGEAVERDDEDSLHRLLEAMASSVRDEDRR